MEIANLEQILPVAGTHPPYFSIVVVLFDRQASSSFFSFVIADLKCRPPAGIARDTSGDLSPFKCSRSNRASRYDTAKLKKWTFLSWREKEVRMREERKWSCSRFRSS